MRVHYYGSHDRTACRQEEKIVVPEYARPGRRMTSNDVAPFALRCDDASDGRENLARTSFSSFGCLSTVLGDLPVEKY